MNMASSSSAAASAQVLPQQKYDVFLSFRGEDTRYKFTSHLYAALKEKNIHTYMDDKSLERGDEIGPALLTAIEQSKLSIIIFSKHYASSSWCLDELLHILKCKEAYGQLVIPIFYDIDPAHVRKQERSYANDLDIMEKRFNMDKVSKWREALTTAGNLSGFDSQNIRDEALLVKRIVEDIVVMTKLNSSLSDDLKGLVGTESRIRQIESLLSIHTHDVPFRKVGIWGTGGIGKTTLAEAIYHQYLLQFEACSFRANIRENAEKYGLDHLKNKLLCDLLKEDNLCIGNPSIESTLVRTRLSRTKVLIVLDDVSVSDLKQLTLLVGDQVQFGPGSRIIITTRERDVLKELVEDDHTYEVKGLETKESVQLFQSIASEDNSFSNMDYLDLSREVVGYAQGIPLSLRVLGSLFRDCDSRKKELQKLKKFRNKNIEDVLRLSYDCLKENEKNIFLDIACFLKGEKRCDAAIVLQMHGLDAARGIDNLINKSLISISMEDCLEIHDLVEELGQSIAREHSSPGQRIRLWKFEDVCDVTGPSTVQALFLDISKIPRRQLIGDTYELFRHMPNLRSLKFYVPIESYDLCAQKKRMDLSRWKELLDVNVLMEYRTMNKCISRGLASLPENLSYLYWDGYPYKYLPSKSPYNLVELHMPHSQVKKLLWTNGQTLRNLKVINLRDSRNLTEVPDLSHNPSIERIDLSGCSKIRNLNYSGDQNRIMLKEMKELLMSWCTNLCSVRHSICNMSCLETLDLRGCRKLQRLPPFSVGHFCFLRRLNLSWCNELVIPDALICLSSLQEIGLSGTMIKSIPASIKNAFKLRKLLLNYCKKLQSLPELPSLLEILEADGCTSLKTVATSSNAPIQDGAPDCNPREKLMFTKSLDQSRKIELLEYLQHAKKASSAHTKSDHGVPKLIQHNAPWLGERHIFTNCFKLDESSRNNITDDAQLRIMRIASSKREYGTVFATCPGNDIPGWFSYQEEGCSITFKIPQTDDENFSGFAISAVFASQNQGWDNLFRLKCDCNFKTDDGKGYEFKFESPLVISMENPPSSVNVEDKDNVLFLFQKDIFCGIPNIPLDKITETSFSFSPEYCYDDDDQEREVGRVQVKKCGIKILYASLPQC